MNRGQSIIEVIVALGITLLMVMGLVVGTTASIRTSETGRQRSLAIKYTQEALEMTRQLRDANWSAFQAKSGLWCLDKAGAWTQVEPCPVNIDSTFRREVNFTWNGTNARMEVTASTYWNDGNTTHKSEIETYFTQWQDL